MLSTGRGTSASRGSVASGGALNASSYSSSIATTQKYDEVRMQLSSGTVKDYMAEPPSSPDPERVRLLVRRFLTRTPTESEVDLLTSFVMQQRVHFTWNPAAARKLAGDGPNAAERAAWTSLARVLMNLDEFVVKD